MSTAYKMSSAPLLREATAPAHARRRVLAGGLAGCALLVLAWASRPAAHPSASAAALAHARRDDDNDGAGDDAGVALDDDIWGLDDDAHDQCQQFRNYNDSSACHDVDEGFCDYQMNKKMSDSDVWYADFVGCSDCDGEWGPCLLGVIVDIQYWCDELTDDTRRARRLARLAYRVMGHWTPPRSGALR